MKTNTFALTFSAKQARVAIVRARFNEAVTGRMLDGCLKTLTERGLDRKSISVAEVPGSFEIPLVVQRFAEKGYDAIITLGCILRGETPHDRYIADAVIPRLQGISLEYNVPVILGIITPLDQAQADARSSGQGNKGVEAAMAALEMIQLLQTHEE
jgi:6,7-dimethyl-8-ribityllumazine synthase